MASGGNDTGHVLDESYIPEEESTRRLPTGYSPFQTQFTVTYKARSSSNEDAASSSVLSLPTPEPSPVIEAMSESSPAELVVSQFYSINLSSSSLLSHSFSVSEPSLSPFSYISSECGPPVHAPSPTTTQSNETQSESSLDTEESVVYTGEACSYTSPSGISLHFPASDCKTDVKVSFKVVHDDYILPQGFEDMSLVSEMFKITASGELPAVTVRMPHCAVVEEDNLLVHMIAHGAPPYRFEILKGGKFPIGESYGEITMSNFSILTTIAQKLGFKLSLSAHVIYHHNNTADFVVTKNLNKKIEAIRSRYVCAIKVVEQPMSCDYTTEAITVTAPNESENGWSVKPEFEPAKIETRDIRKYREGRTPPSVHFNMEWTGKGSPVEGTVKIALGGVSVESFLLHCRPAQVSPSPSLQQSQAQPFSPQLSATSDTSSLPYTPTLPVSQPQSPAQPSLGAPPPSPQLSAASDTFSQPHTPTLPVNQQLSSPIPPRGDRPSLSVEARALRASNDVFTTGGDPDNLVKKLYSKELLTPEERERATQETLTTHQKLQKTLEVMERRVSVNPEVFHTLVEILKAEPATEEVGNAMQGIYDKTKKDNR